MEMFQDYVIIKTGTIFYSYEIITWCDIILFI